MAKQTGLGWTTLSLDDGSGAVEAIKNDVTDLQFATPRGVQDVTGVDKSAFERLLSLADFSATLKGVFNPGVSPSSHDCLKTVSSSAQVRTLTLTVGGVTLANEVIVTDYQLARASNGELTFTAPCQLANGTVPTWA